MAEFGSATESCPLLAWIANVLPVLPPTMAKDQLSGGATLIEVSRSKM